MLTFDLPDSPRATSVSSTLTLPSSTGAERDPESCPDDTPVMEGTQKPALGIVHREDESDFDGSFCLPPPAAQTPRTPSMPAETKQAIPIATPTSRVSHKRKRTGMLFKATIGDWSTVHFNLNFDTQKQVDDVPRTKRRKVGEGKGKGKEDTSSFAGSGSEENPFAIQD